MPDKVIYSGTDKQLTALIHWASVICELKSLDGGLAHLAMVPQEHLIEGRELLKSMRVND